jgi:hypothetical protein
VAEVPRNVLGEHAEALIADVLDQREKAIVNIVLFTLSSGKPLEPQVAIQKWLELAEARKLRTALVNRSKQENLRVAAQG